MTYPLANSQPRTFWQKLRALRRHVNGLRIARPVLQNGRYHCRVSFQVNGQPIAINVSVSKALVLQARTYAKQKLNQLKSGLNRFKQDVGFAGIDWEPEQFERASTDPFSQSPSVFGDEGDLNDAQQASLYGDSVFGAVLGDDGFCDDGDDFGDAIRAVKNSSLGSGEIQSGSAASYDYNPYTNPWGEGGGYADPYAQAYLQPYATPYGANPYAGYQSAYGPPPFDPYGVPGYGTGYSPYTPPWAYFAGDYDGVFSEESFATWNEGFDDGQWDDFAGIWESMDGVMNVIGDVASNPVVAGAISAIPYGALVVAGVNATVAGYKITRHYTSDTLRKKQAQLAKAQKAAKAAGNPQAAAKAQQELAKVAAIDKQLAKLKADAKAKKPEAIKAVKELKAADVANKVRLRALRGDRKAIKFMASVRAGVNKKDPEALKMYALLEALQKQVGGGDAALPAAQSVLRLAHAETPNLPTRPGLCVNGSCADDDDDDIYEEDSDFAEADSLDALDDDVDYLYAPAIETYYDADDGFGDIGPAIVGQIVNVAQQAAQLAPDVLRLVSVMDSILEKTQIGQPSTMATQLSYWKARPVKEAVAVVSGGDPKKAHNINHFAAFLKKKSPAAYAHYMMSLKAAAAAKESGDGKTPVSSLEKKFKKNKQWAAYYMQKWIRESADAKAAGLPPPPSPFKSKPKPSAEALARAAEQRARDAAMNQQAGGALGEVAKIGTMSLMDEALGY